MNFTADESDVLELLQKGLPPLEEPFRYIGESAGLDEDKVISLVRDLKERKIIRNISGIFEGKSLGYTLSLVAFQVKDENIEKAAAVINSHPGVSHNYLRRHRFNIWFTLAEESSEAFEKAVDVLFKKSGADDFLVLRNEKLFKIGVILDLGTSVSDSVSSSSQVKEGAENSIEMTEEMRKSVNLLQKDLPPVKSPFKKLIEDNEIDIKISDFISNYSRLLKAGVMRRYAAVLRHREAGFTSNAMTAWKTGPDFNPEIFRSNKAITHLYLRTLFPGKWEYPLFAMIHARSGEELKSTVDELALKSGINDYLVLDSLREFKKSRVNYFSEEFKEWKRENYD